MVMMTMMMTMMVDVDVDGGDDGHGGDDDDADEAVGGDDSRESRTKVRRSQIGQQTAGSETQSNLCDDRNSCP